MPKADIVKKLLCPPKVFLLFCLCRAVSTTAGLLPVSKPGRWMQCRYVDSTLQWLGDCYFSFCIYMSFEIAGTCSDTWNTVMNVAEHWIGKSRKLEIAKCGMLLGRCYFAVHHKYNTEMLPLVTYTCCWFYANKDLKCGENHLPNQTT